MQRVVELFRLIFLMALCGFIAFVASSFVFHAYDVDPGILLADHMRVGIIGAAVGAGLELAIRGWRPSRRVTVWGILQLTAIVAIILLIVATWTNPPRV